MRRNTEWYYFKGKGSWSKLFEPDMEYGEWQQKLHMIPESVELFKKLKQDSTICEGIKNELKEDEDGIYHTFRRKLRKDYTDKTGQTREIIFPPPIVLDVDGNPWDRRIQIGNGSDLEVKVEHYTYPIKFSKGRRGSAIRFSGVKVLNLVPYGVDSFSEKELKQADGLLGQSQAPTW